MDTTLSFDLNGEPCAISVDPETPLLYVLRRDLGMSATRFGCGDGLCGACTVIVDGRALPSCDTPVGAVAGKAVETAEGMAQGDTAHPIVTALIEEQAGQCGYCLPGIVMSAKALLHETPQPTRTQIAAALDGNLCRCGAHLRILRAIELAAERMRGGTT